MTISKTEADLLERVAVLESKQETQEELNKKLDALLSKLDRYEGKLGGILLVVCAVLAFLHFDPSKILAWIKSLI